MRKRREHGHGDTLEVGAGAAEARGEKGARYAGEQRRGPRPTSSAPSRVGAAACEFTLGACERHGLLPPELRASSTARRIKAAASKGKEGAAHRRTEWRRAGDGEEICRCGEKGGRGQQMGRGGWGCGPEGVEMETKEKESVCMTCGVCNL